MKYPFYSRRSIIALFLMFLTWQLSSSSKTDSFTESSSLIQTCYQKLLGSSMRPKPSLESKVMNPKNLLVSAKQYSDVPALLVLLVKASQQLYKIQIHFYAWM